MRCSIVEFASPEDAQRTIRELSEIPLLGRPVFIRKDRENESRFGPTPRSNPGNQLYVGNLPYQAGWQDLKDLFRAAGNIIRADINIGADGRPKGSGTVVFETQKDAQQAISMYSGFDWYGRTLEVRESKQVRSVVASAALVAVACVVVSEVDMRRRGPAVTFLVKISMLATQGPINLVATVVFVWMVVVAVVMVEATAIWNLSQASKSWYAIVVRDHWEVELAERTGCGVVQFAQVSEAETAIAKFQQYMYGGRPLNVRFNDRWHTVTPTAAKGGQVMPMQPDM
ncbi:hypothetical protein JVT61DRAFT_2655 [Boletus reticuloceps]|uniref:RRM domain-containing protein n=1 Tax=Boletus reticuloceps TaxID=495285 RepID=A0A8I2YNB2_9AGAM|nr:hypothetical protein JVT61DRAFT_2655 [Boletus reticuloceps]